MKPNPGTNAGPLVGRPRPWGLATGPRDSQSYCQTTGTLGSFLTQLALGSALSQSLCWSAGVGDGTQPDIDWCWSSDGWTRSYHSMLWGSNCPGVNVNLLVGEAGPEARAGLLVCMTKA